MNKEGLKKLIFKKCFLHGAKNATFVVRFALAAICIYALCSCATYNWNNSWPTYKVAPTSKAQIALVETKDVFTLMRAKWYSNKIGIEEKDSYAFFGNLTDSIVKVTLKKFYPELTQVPSETRKQFTEETIRFDKKIFLKGRFPEQGKSIVAGATTPPYLLLIHEITLGTDLNKQEFFDFDLKQNEMDVHKTVTNMTVILTFTLWDNIKQVPLYSSILEENMPVTSMPNLSDIERLLTMAIAKIPLEIAQGAK